MASLNGPKEMRDQIISELKKVAVSALVPYAQRICLFGSVARGDFDEASDIDLLIELKDSNSRPPLTLVGLADIRLKLSQMLGRQVDPVTKLKPQVRERAEKYFIVLWRGGD